MFKNLYAFIVDPLGLPLDWTYEYLIMILIDIVAYYFAYEKTGELMKRGIVLGKAEGSAVHWIIRSVFFVGVWAIIRFVIWLYGFVIENKDVSIFALSCLIAIHVTINIFKKIGENWLES